MSKPIHYSKRVDIMIKWHDLQWAKDHDWYHSSETNTDGSYRVWVKRPEGGIILSPFSDIEELRIWAGY